MKMTHIDVPGEFSRNSPNVLAVGVEKTGSTIINCGNELLGCSDLSGKDVLDIGCGVRFTQTIINCGLPLKSYTGIDIYEPVINFLINNVHDTRFSYHYWHIYNRMYNTTGQHLTKSLELPLPRHKKFDVIWMYSVITHQYPSDTECLFYILKRYINRKGGLLFSAFIDNDIDTFEDKVKDQPLLNAYYNETFLRKLLSKTGWEVESVYRGRPDPVMQNLFLCRPKYRFWKLF